MVFLNKNRTKMSFAMITFNYDMVLTISSQTKMHVNACFNRNPQCCLVNFKPLLHFTDVLVRNCQLSRELV